MAEKLLPCPFCGGPAEIVDIDEGENAGGSCVCCTRCMACGNVEFDFKENFYDNWNSRVTDARVSGLLAALEAVSAAIGDWSRPTGANGMTSPPDDHPLLEAQRVAYDAIAKAELEA